VEEDDVVGAVMGLEADAVRADGLPLSQFFPNCFLISLMCSQLCNYDFVVFLWQIALFVLLPPFLPSGYSLIRLIANCLSVMILKEGYLIRGIREKLNLGKIKHYTIWGHHSKLSPQLASFSGLFPLRWVQKVERRK
jgi:hypothetical protein